MSIGARLQNLERRNPQGPACPTCGKPILVVDCDEAGGVPFCLHCGGQIDRNDLPQNCKEYIGIRELRALI